MSPIDLNDPVAVLLAAAQALEKAGIEAATFELHSLASEIPDHDVMSRWERVQQAIRSKTS